MADIRFGEEPNEDKSADEHYVRLDSIQQAYKDIHECLYFVRKHAEKVVFHSKEVGWELEDDLVKRDLARKLQSIEGLVNKLERRFLMRMESNEDKSADMLSREEGVRQTYENIYSCLTDAHRFGKLVRDYQKREHRWSMEDDLHMRNHLRTLRTIEPLIQKSEVEDLKRVKEFERDRNFGR